MYLFPELMYIKEVENFTILKGKKCFAGYGDAVPFDIQTAYRNLTNKTGTAHRMRYRFAARPWCIYMQLWCIEFMIAKRKVIAEVTHLLPHHRMSFDSKTLTSLRDRCHDFREVSWLFEHWAMIRAFNHIQVDVESL